ncbi:MAG: restriction endonuclease subunit S [Lachnospiraceae bacterium]|nr:restriction endonuclease subunit S [Lachnospiraceae bacterium]
MSRVPRIRFKGFEEDWEQRKLGEVGKARSGIGFPDSEQGGTIGTPFFKVSDMNIDGNENEMTAANNYVTTAQIVAHKWSPIEELPAIFFAKVGAAVMLNRKRLCRFPFLLDNNTMAYSLDKTKWNADFAKALFDTVDLTSLVQVGALPSYNSEDIEAMEILLPSLSEQSKIGAFFKKIDHLITLHQRKLEKLKIIKKSMLENLFPQNGEKTPKIRFSGFTGDWEQRKLGEYLIQYTEVTIINDQYPVLTSSRKGIFFQKDYYDGNQIASENNIGYNIVPYGYFTYRHMSDDEIFYFNINNIIDNGIVSTLYPVFTTNDRLDSKFLQYELNFGKEFRKYSVLQKQGGSRTYMYFNKLRDLKLTITTSLKEQECIRNLICSIDHLITLHQGKLEKLQKIKKSMLESMFV